MLICDAHADTLYALQDASRDPAIPCDITPERMRSGGHTRVQAMALWTGMRGLRGDDRGLIERELRSLDALEAAGMRRITRVSDARPGETSVLLTIEGGEVFEPGLETVDQYAALGVRCAALVWNNDNALAFSSKGGSGEGLTAYGREVVARMGALRMAVDVSHMNEAGFDDVLRYSALPPLASHSGCRALCDHRRNLTDRQLKALFSAGGFVGVYFYPPFLCGREKAPIDTVVDHIDRMAQLGGGKHIGFGSDFDGIETYIEGLEHPGKIDALLDRLRARGYSEEVVCDIAGENFRRYLDAI